MTFLSFTKVIPATAPTPFVNVTTHLNNNWDEIDSKIAALGLLPSLPANPEQGQEWYYGASKRFRVWNGAAIRDPDNIDTAWSAWAALPLSGNVALRTGFTPRWRSNSLLRKIQLAGGLLKDGAGSAWPANTFVVATTGTSGIPNTQGPIGNLSVQQTAAALPTAPAHGAAGYVKVDTSGAWVRIQVEYIGGPGGGNFLQLDGVEWWY